MRSCIVLLWLSFLGHAVLAQQNTLSSQEALTQFNHLWEDMNRTFPEDDFKTYRRTSFTEAQLQTYLSQYYQLMDLLNSVTGHHKLKVDTYLHFGYWFHQIEFPQQAITAYNHFFDYSATFSSSLEILDQESYIKKQNYAYSATAEDYAKLNQLDKASQMHLANIAFSKAYPGISFPSALNNYGLFFYWHKHDLENALKYFKEAQRATLDYNPNHTLIGSIRDNIADVYVDQGQYALALPLYKTNFHFFQHTPIETTQQLDSRRLISAGAQLVSTYVKLNRITEAEATFKTLQEIKAQQDQQLHPYSTIEILQAKEDLALGQANPMTAYHASKAILTLSDSIHEASKKIDERWVNEFNKITFDRVALNHKIDQMNKESKIKSQRINLWLFALVFSIILILLASLFVRRRQHLINAKNKQLLAEKTLENSTLKVKQLNFKIASKERDLSDFAINLSQNQEWVALLAQKIEALKQANQQEKNKLLEDLENEINNKVTFDKNTKDFFERLDKLSDAFYSKLTNDFPSLSKNEIRLCSLIRLKIDSRSIATLQNITLASLNTSRYRLRKKLRLKKHKNLDTFIQNI
ncbi:hypothetical protein IA57_03845 [Mangrovimonas yunxiaonensis]|uniref:MalT-like TPR region domain-containing protein n=1 Tax=Mangrovimonas yunxiaonensis TaxID=1197477 RepID=A0A084TMR7_9FLAO|nr:tetratricopeptide repeat protein [Mangrovimonas yunxiaonensis]KFB02003.1 hypothetical protein IA57_03845 [Mangrovimonas yunxiaonensis]